MTACVQMNMSLPQVKRDLIKAIFEPLTKCPQMINQDICENPNFVQDTQGSPPSCLLDCIPGFQLPRDVPATVPVDVRTYAVTLKDVHTDAVAPNGADLITAPITCCQFTFLHAVAVLQNPELSIMVSRLDIKKHLQPLARAWAIPRDVEVTDEVIHSTAKHLGVRILVLEKDKRTVTTYDNVNAADSTRKSVLLIVDAKSKYALYVFSVEGEAELVVDSQTAMNVALSLRQATS